jgi:pimeloyl-ACP methyl ester carboxylesterase
MPDLHVQGHRLHYSEREGDGPALLMLCSTGLDPRQWTGLLRKLPNRRAVGLTYLGYPPSERWKGEGTPDIGIDLLAAEQLLLAEDGPVDILGHSYGGYLGLHLAQKHPTRVRRIAAHEPTAWGTLAESGRQDLIDDFAQVNDVFFGERTDPEGFLQHFVDYWNTPGSWDAMPEHRKAGWRVLYPKVWAEARLLCQETTPLDFYRQIPHPTRITLSPETAPHQFAVVTQLVEAMPHAELISVPGGHMGVLTHPHEVLPHLAAWLDV